MLVKLMRLVLLALPMGLAACSVPLDRGLLVDTPPAPIASSPMPNLTKHIVSNGAGGFTLPDGSNVAADPNGGFTLPNGSYVARNSAGGVTLPNGTECISDRADGYACP